MEKAIIIRASSGIGRALAKELAVHGFAVGLAARRLKSRPSKKETGLYHQTLALIRLVFETGSRPIF